MKLLLLTVLFLVAFFTVHWAYAQQQNPCTSDRNVFVNKITKQHQEVRYLVLIRGADRIFEIYLNKVSGSWTVLRSNSDGSACIMADGRDFIMEKDYGKGVAYVP